MKKFILKILLLSVSFTVLMAVFLYFGKIFYFNSDYLIWKSKIQYINTSKENKNVIIGDSRLGVGVLPKIVGNNFYNLAVPAGTPISSYFILEKYLKKHKNIDEIIVFHSEEVLQNNEYFTRDYECSLMNFNQLSDFLQVSKELNTNLSGNKFDSELDYYKFFIEHHLGYFHFFMNYRASLKQTIKNGILKRYRKNKKYNFETIHSNLGQFYLKKNHSPSGLYWPAKQNFLKPNKVTDYYLNKLFVLAQKNNIKVYYIHSPLNQATFSKLNPNFVKDYNSYMQSLKEKYPNVIWYADLFSYPNDCFGDKIHLNKKGALKFSQYVKGIIN